MRNELQSYLSGNEQLRRENPLWAVASLLGAGQRPSTGAEGIKPAKGQEEVLLKRFAKQHGLMLLALPSDNYFAEGAEQRVFLAPDGMHVWKANASVFYEAWEDYFLSLLLHNYFFPATAYRLLGFTSLDGDFCAVVKQPFVPITAPTDLAHVRAFLQANGFVGTRNNDYRHPDGIILEDLHEENVLTNSGVLFFVDTVFYLEPRFFQK